MNKIIKEIIKFSHFAFVVLGIMLSGLKLGIHNWIIVIFVVAYITFILKYFKLEQKSVKKEE